ncbi:hypothetical protein ATANTOWER_018494 [Ataeniobius toweri]|uniref:Uncharacterized protein n=1 Tax=Ataeniobius toweri TaxID=208326 RepID=A0ABU7B7D2_9TELE|nr:hypothetical protein [Ataeniobius toweri]
MYVAQNGSICVVCILIQSYLVGHPGLNLVRPAAFRIDLGAGHGRLPKLTEVAVSPLQHSEQSKAELFPKATNANDPKHTTHTIKHGGGSIMLMGSESVERRENK